MATIQWDIPICRSLLQGFPKPRKRKMRENSLLDLSAPYRHFYPFPSPRQRQRLDAEILDVRGGREHPFGGVEPEGQAAHRIVRDP